MLLEESKGWQVIIGLILGGVIAAPMALLVNKIKDDDDFGWNFNYYFKFKIIKIIIMSTAITTALLEKTASFLWKKHYLLAVL
jgi:hypothetical protein